MRAREAARTDDFWYLTYSTFSHCDEQERYRVIVPLAIEHDPRALRQMYDWVRDEKGLTPDPSGCTPAHKFFLPERPLGAEYIWWLNEAPRLLDLSHLKPQPEQEKSHEPQRSAAVPRRGDLKDSPTLDPDNDEAIIIACGAPPGTQINQAIRSLVSAEEHASTWFYRDKNGYLKYYFAHRRPVTRVIRDKESGCCDESTEDASRVSMPCALVIASRINQRIIVRVYSPELRVWDLLLSALIGHIQPVEIPHAPLPDDVQSSVPRAVLQRVHDGFILLMGLRAAFNDGNVTPVPYSWGFAARWCGLDKALAGAAIEQLKKCDLIQPEGTYKAYGKDFSLLTTRPVADN